MNTEPLTQLNKRRTRLVPGHQLVYLSRDQKSLSHPNCTDHPTSRVHHSRLQRPPIRLVDATRPA
ncbi:hypothetical protein [Brachybacterium sacelli]|uniref:hypothetical protein n=1 Tax=Brachybacterium sacelli TaxID=173364 RepID=UPI00361CE12E